MNPIRTSLVTQRIPMTAALVATVLGWMMALTGSAQISLDPASFTSVAIGGATPVGAVTPGGDGYTMTGGGTTVGGLSDSFQFYYQSFVGDFDVSIRVESLSLNDAWTKAGLMARESATPNSRYAASMATPAGAGTLFLARTATGGDTTNRSSTFPVTYPNTWLRLKRVGTTFTGYAGLDGASWTLLGTSTLPVAQATPMLVGLALVSQSNSLLATAQFRTLANVTGTPPVGSVSLPREPIGPSSRRTELVISEIMYHPRSVPVFSNRLEYIELYNSQAFDAAIGGFRISGNVDYTFPAGTVMKPGQFLVVARDPGAMQSYYGITGVLGPWHGASTNSLPGGSGTVRLRNRQGAVMLEVNYKGGNPWPVAADGAGHSLVLNRASYGERDSKGWSASDTIDGSPGKDEPFSGDPLRSVVINEFLAHTSVAGGLEDYVELYNHSRAAVNLSGAYLTDEAGSNKYRFAEGTTLGATNFLSLSASQLGFSLSADGERIFLVNSNQSRVIDAIEFGAQADGVSFGRIPDGGSDFYQLASRTPGAPNGGQLQRPVVINELMYNPISGDSADEYIELYNRSGTPVDVGLWKFTSGVNFTLPTNTVIPVGGMNVTTADGAFDGPRFTMLIVTVAVVPGVMPTVVAPTSRSAVAAPTRALDVIKLSRTCGSRVGVLTEAQPPLTIVVGSATNGTVRVTVNVLVAPGARLPGKVQVNGPTSRPTQPLGSEASVVPNGGK